MNTVWPLETGTFDSVDPNDAQPSSAAGELQSVRTYVVKKPPGPGVMVRSPSNSAVNDHTCSFSKPPHEPLVKARPAVKLPVLVLSVLSVSGLSHASRVQVALQPSLSLRLPSSQTSPGCKRPSPHTGFGKHTSEPAPMSWHDCV